MGQRVWEIALSGVGQMTYLWGGFAWGYWG